MPSYYCERCNIDYPRHREFNECVDCGCSTKMNWWRTPSLTFGQAMDRKLKRLNMRLVMPADATEHERKVAATVAYALDAQASSPILALHVFHRL